MFYTFSQSNPGGFYDDTMPQYVVIQAASAEIANSRAESVGIYFDGSAYGTDCSCCGDRWYRVREDDGTEVPEVYGVAVTPETEDVVIHYFTPLEKLL